MDPYFDVAFRHGGGEFLVFSPHHQFAAGEQGHDARFGEGPAQTRTNPDFVAFGFNGRANGLQIDGINSFRDNLVGGLGAAQFHCKSFRHGSHLPITWVGRSEGRKADRTGGRWGDPRADRWEGHLEGQKADRTEDRWEGPRVDRWEDHLEGQKADRTGGRWEDPRVDRWEGHLEDHLED